MSPEFRPCAVLGHMAEPAQSIFSAQHLSWALCGSPRPVEDRHESRSPAAGRRGVLFLETRQDQRSRQRTGKRVTSAPVAKPVGRVGLDPAILDREAPSAQDGDGAPRAGGGGQPTWRGTALSDRAGCYVAQLS